MQVNFNYVCNGIIDFLFNFFNNDLHTVNKHLHSRDFFRSKIYLLYNLQLQVNGLRIPENSASCFRNTLRVGRLPLCELP